MTEPVWRWLPDVALSDARAVAALDRALADWSRRWLPETRLRAQTPGVGSVDARPASAGGVWVAVRPAPSGANALVGRALGLDLARLEAGDGDRRVLDAFAEAMLADLAETLDGLASAEPGAEVSGPVQVALADEDGRRLLTLSTSRAFLSAVRRSGLPKRVAKEERLGTIGSAVAEADVALTAQLGSAVMPLTEARRLAPGDVIILDRRLDEPLDLVVAPNGSRLARGRLIDTASPRALRLQPSPARVVA